MLLEKWACRLRVSNIRHRRPGIVRCRRIIETPKRFASLTAHAMQDPGIPDVALPPGCTMVSAATCASMWSDDFDPNHPLAKVWPEYINKSASCVRYADMLGKVSSLAPFQLFVLRKNEQGEEDAVANYLSIPFFMPGLDSQRPGLAHNKAAFDALPAGGFDAVMARGVLQAKARGEELPPDSSTDPVNEEQKQDLPISSRTESPNVLSALAASVVPECRSLGLALVLLDAMKHQARNANIKYLVVPLRPTRKCDFPNVSFSEYIKWQRGPNNQPLKPGDSQYVTGVDATAQAFDPWLRKHLEMGAEIIKIAPSSTVIEGTKDEWQQWTGFDFAAKAAEAVAADPSCVKDGIVEMPLDQALAPLCWHLDQNFGRYTEPNVWVCHSV